MNIIQLGVLQLSLVYLPYIYKDSYPKNLNIVNKKSSKIS